MINRNKTRRVRQSKPISLLVGILFASMVLAPAAASAQGLFDFLFGGGQRQSYDRAVVAYAPDTTFAPRDAFDRDLRKERRKRVKLSPSVEKALADAAGPKKVAPPEVGKGPLGPFLNDPTLRAGDVVVTDRGVMVYRGNGGTRHAASDFVDVARAGGVGSARSQDLAQIERANRQGQIAVTPTQTASVDLTQVKPPEGAAKRRIARTPN